MLQFCDSFGHYLSLGSKWSAVSGSAVQIFPTRSFGRVNGSSMSNSRWAGEFAQKSLPNTATGVVGFAIFIPSSGAVNNGNDFVYWIGTGYNISLRLTASLNIQLVLNGTVAATSSASIAAGVWQFIEAGLTIGMASGSYGTATIKIQGTTVISYTGTLSLAVGNLGFYTGIQLGSTYPSSGAGGSAAPWYITDVYMLDNTGSYNNTFLGDTSVLSRVPTANGTQNNYTATWASWPASTAVAVGSQILDTNGNVQRVQSISGTGTTGSSHPTWATTGGLTTVDNAGANQVTWVVVGAGANPGAANWMAVSEIPPDGDDSYDIDSTVNDEDRFTFPSIAGSQVFAAAVNMCAEKDNTGARSIRGVTKSGSTQGTSPSDLVLAMGYAIYQGIIETDPNTSVPWTVAGVNAAEFGSKTTV